VSRSGITMARSIVLVDFDAPTAFYDVDFRVMLLVVGLKVGWSVNSMLDSAFESVSDSASDSAFDSAVGDIIIGEVVGEVVGLAMHLASASLVLLKLTFRFVRTIFLTGFYSLNMVVVSYPNSHCFSDRSANLLSSLACGLSAYAAYPKVLICLYRGTVSYNISCSVLLLGSVLVGDRFVR
jgi:hypothetical protein